MFDKLPRRHETTSTDRSRAVKRLDELVNERIALNRAHLAGAVPLDLLKQEQDRITVEMPQNQGIIDPAAVTAS